MPRRPLAVFESWRGRYADSPREISQALGEATPRLRRLWVGESGFPEDVGSVRRHSPAYFARLWSCDLLVANDIVTKLLRKGPRTFYLQCWHGTPLKLLGHDETKATYAGHAEHMARLRRDVDHWDALLSPSAEVTEIFRSAFGYEGEVWETGYPRNDPLLAADAAQRREQVRAQLGLEPRERAVLWAPTWRDDQRDDAGRLTMRGLLDVRRLVSGLPEGTRLLLRLHKNVVGAAPDLVAPGALDVSSHPDITDLYLAADVLVSDYSSAVFDFAVTGKPMVLHVPDLEHYRDRARGMYFDYESWAPGPLTRSTEELADVLGGDQRAGYEDFRRRFCPHEDGGSTQRVLQRLLEASGLGGL